MKNTLLSALSSAVLAGIMLLAAGPAAQAKIWRVDNNGGSPGDFTTVAGAIADSRVVDNDTLYFNGSGTSYGDATISKRVFMFGPGYFLAQNTETQASPTAATVGTLTFSSGASGSLITGMSFARFDINADNILVKRNYGTNGSGTEVVLVRTGRSNVLIVQNYLYQSYYGRCVWVQGGCSNVLVSNNFLGTFYNSNDPSYAALYSQSSLTVTQNMVYRAWVITDNSSITNNIIREGGIQLNSNGVFNNIGSDGNTPAPAGNNNQQNVTMSNVFVLTGSDDAVWKLKAGSPALAAGQNGEDVGMYGGTDPYVLSGLPAIPAIWFFAAPSSGSGASGLQVRIKAKSHN